MDDQTKYYIKSTLDNDELSSYKEKMEYFVKEGGLTLEKAANWVALRDQYLRELFCNAGPED